MADLSFLSEIDDSAVEDIISEANDLIVLEQIASINLSGVSDSLLPTDLETRFRKLKSFPGANPNPKPQIPPPCLNPQMKSTPTNLNPSINTPTSPPDAETDSQSQSSKLKSINRAKTSPDYGQNDLKPISRTGSVSSPSISSESSLESLSPPRQTCCWCSPKRVSKKKRKENTVTGIGLDWAKNEDFLSDLSTFSKKEQRRKLKKALKEEEKINREAEKVVKWAKQASARMDDFVIQNLSSDDEKFK